MTRRAQVDWEAAPSLRHGTRVERVRAVLKRGGPRLLAVKLLGETVYRWQALVALELESRPAIESRLALQYAYLGPSEVAEYAAFHPHASSEQASARLERRERCLVARHRGRIVASVWAAPEGGPTRDVEPWPRVASDEVYVYDAYTSPAYRGWGAYPALSSELAGLLAAEGYRQLLGTVHLDAGHAFAAHALAGYRRFGTVGRLLRPIARELHVFEEGRPGGARWGTSRLYAVDLRGGAPGFAARVPLRFATLSKDAIDRYLALRPSASRAEIARRLAGGERCVLAEREGEAVAAVWIADSRSCAPTHRIPMRLLRREAYVYDELVEPGQRGLRIAGALRAHALGDLARADVEQALTVPSGDLLPGERRFGRVAPGAERSRLDPWPGGPPRGGPRDAALR